MVFSIFALAFFLRNSSRPTFSCFIQFINWHGGKFGVFQISARNIGNKSSKLRHWSNHGFLANDNSSNFDNFINNISNVCPTENSSG